MRIDNIIETLFEKSKVNENRIDKIMEMIESEPAPVVPLKRKGLNRKFVSMAAAVLICFTLFIPIGGQTFAGTVIEWFKETLIETDTGFIEAVDEKLTGVLDEHVTTEYDTEVAVLDEMGELKFEIPVLPENFIFDSGTINVFGELPFTTSIYLLKYVDHTNITEDEVSLFIQVSVSNYERFEEDENVTYGVKVIAEGLKSTAIPFLEEEALFLNYNGVYSIGAPHVFKDFSDDMVNDISCSISYKNIGGPELWAEAQRVLETIFLQYK